MPRSSAPTGPRALRSPRRSGQVEAVRSGAGIGILHTFIARGVPELVPVKAVAPIRRAYWLVYHESVRPLRRVQAVASFIARQVAKDHRLFV